MLFNNLYLGLPDRQVGLLCAWELSIVRPHHKR